jgi:DNA polymerase-3 subunit delta'
VTWTEVVGHERPKKILQSALARSEVAHAYLFHGDAAIGKLTTARVFAQAVQCERHNLCGNCQACRAIQSGAHPDLQIIEPDGSQIKIEQIRALQDALIFKPLLGVRKIMIINDAELMNPEASNCFLKTLEEPPDHSLLLLVTSQPNRLLPTILSRCQRIRFDPPNRDAIATLLVQRRGLNRAEAELLAALSMGKIGLALTADLATLKGLRDEALSLLTPKILVDLDRLLSMSQKHAENEEGLYSTLDFLLIWLRDLLVFQHHPDTRLLINRDRLDELRRQSRQLPPAAALKIMELLGTIHRLRNRHLNRTLVLETVLFDLRDHLREASS